MKSQKKYLKILKDYLFKFFNRDQIASSDLYYLLARFLRHSNQFAAVAKNVRTSAFLPHPSNLDLSVFGINHLSAIQIWTLSVKYLSSAKDKPIKGRADIFAEDVNNIGLRLSRDNNPPRHANIIGWPETKHEQKLIAAKLALKANLVLNPIVYP